MIKYLNAQICRISDVYYIITYLATYNNNDEDGLKTFSIYLRDHLYFRVKEMLRKFELLK